VIPVDQNHMQRTRPIQNNLHLRPEENAALHATFEYVKAVDITCLKIRTTELTCRTMSQKLLYKSLAVFLDI